MVCDCGGAVVSFNPKRDEAEALLKIIGRPRYSKKSRLVKKFHKQWLTRPRVKEYRFACLLAPIMRCYRCASCGKKFSLYAMAAKAFTVEPL